MRPFIDTCSVWGIATCCVFMVNPNEGRVVQLFGEYKGTVKGSGVVDPNLCTT